MPHRHTYMGVIWQYATHTHTYVGFGLRVQACTARLHSVDHPALDSALAPFSRGRWRMVPYACSVRVRLGAPPQTQPGRCGPQRKASCFCEVALPVKNSAQKRTAAGLAAIERPGSTAIDRIARTKQVAQNSIGNTAAAVDCFFSTAQQRVPARTRNTLHELQGSQDGIHPY